MDCNSSGFPVLHHLPEFTQTHVQWVGDAIQPSHPLLPPPSFALSLSAFPMSLVFASDGQSIGASASGSLLLNEYSGFISFRIDWFHLLAVRGTLKSLLQHHSLKALILQCSAFVMFWLSHSYMTSGKATALTIQTFVSKDEKIEAQKVAPLK